MAAARILLQLDPDKHASVFDAVVAVDSGAEQLLQYSGVLPGDVQGLVHGAIFTRSPANLKSTAIFIGGSDVGAGETLLAAVKKSFVGPMQVSVMLDANGANTTAAAAVVAAGRHLDLGQTRALVLAGTGPVGQRAARLLASRGAEVRVASRHLARAQTVVDGLAQISKTGRLVACQIGEPAELTAALRDVHLVIAAGAAGVELLPLDARLAANTLRVMIDLNAVPPLGIAGVSVFDAAKPLEQGVVAYGAIGVGGTKMKIHRAALQQLFESNDRVLDADEIYQIGLQLESAQ